MAAMATDGFGPAASAARAEIERERITQKLRENFPELHVFKVDKETFQEISYAAWMRADTAPNKEDVYRKIMSSDVVNRALENWQTKGFEIENVKDIIGSMLIEPSKQRKRSRQNAFATHSSGSTASTLVPNKNLSDNMRRALISFFQNFYDTEEISGLREFFEAQLTSTKTQMALSGWVGPVDSIAPLLSLSLRKEFEELKSKGKNEKVAFQIVLEKFKQSYSWLSSVRMDDDGSGKPKHNQDEHALPFLFMLLFGGGIASVPFKKPYEGNEIAKKWHKYVELAAKEGRNEDEQIEMDEALKIVTEHNDTIAAAGGDPMFYIKVTDIISLVLNILRKKKSKGSVDLLLQNLLSLNYYGLYLSETDFNQWKSNLLFIKMVEVDEEIHFTPWVALIEKYMDAAEASLLECMSPSSSSGAASENKTRAFKQAKGLVSQRNHKSVDVDSNDVDYVGTIDSVSSSTQKHYYPSVAEGMPPRKDCTGFNAAAFHNMQRVFRNKAGQFVPANVAEWKETAIDNMVFILDYLCKHYSRHLKDRVFLNCVVYKWLLGNKSRKVRAPVGAAKDQRNRGIGGIATGTPPRSKSRISAPKGSAKKPNSKLTPTDKVTDAMNQFIELYLDEHGIVLAEEVELKGVLEGDPAVLAAWKEKRKIKAEKKKTKKKRQKNQAAANYVKHDVATNTLFMGGRKTRRKKRRRKTKRKKKRKKKTKRRRKKKKKTRKK